MEAAGRNIHQGLIEGCRENDRKAQLEIYKLYYKPMYNTSLRIVNDEAEAEDVMQESFLDAFRKIGDYKGEGDFGGWLRRIVVNNSLDVLKKKKDMVMLDESHLNIKEEEDTFSDTIEYKVAEIKHAINQLPEDHRVILSLFLFEGYDHEEISQVLDISYNASRTRYSRAKARLLRILSEQRTVKMFFSN